MKFLRKIFGLKKFNSSIKTVEPNYGISVNKSSWYQTHIKSLSNEFEFLLTQFGFEILKKNEFVGHELWTIYVKDAIKIQIWGDVGDLPFVFIQNTELPYDESKQLDNRDSIDEFNPTAKKIRQDWINRRKPLQKRFMAQWSAGNLDLSELNMDYENMGKQEHTEYLHQAAITVRYNLKNQIGKLVNVP